MDPCWRLIVPFRQGVDGTFVSFPRTIGDSDSDEDDVVKRSRLDWVADYVYAAAEWNGIYLNCGDAG